LLNQSRQRANCFVYVSKTLSVNQCFLSSMVNNGQSLLRPSKNFIKVAKMGTRDVQIEEF